MRKVQERDNSIDKSVWPIFSDEQLTKIFQLNKEIFRTKNLVKPIVKLFSNYF